MLIISPQKRKALFLGLVLYAGGMLPIALAAGQSGGVGASAGAITVPERVVSGRCLSQVSPVFPSGYEQSSATVVLSVLISREGTVSPLHLVSGDTAFELSAMNAVRQWRYRPYLRGREAVSVITTVHVNFTPGKAGGILSHPNG
jgi:TonB family protein